jgi:hypothetical protein
MSRNMSIADFSFCIIAIGLPSFPKFIFLHASGSMGGCNEFPALGDEDETLVC